MNNSLGTLISNLEEYNEILATADKTSADYTEMMLELQDIVIGLTGANEDLILSNDFIIENFELIEEAAKGSTEAIQKLGVATAKF
jgi:hypothetical protein